MKQIEDIILNKRFTINLNLSEKITDLLSIQIQIIKIHKKFLFFSVIKLRFITSDGTVIPIHKNDYMVNLLFTYYWEITYDIIKKELNLYFGTLLDQTECFYKHE